VVDAQFAASKSAVEDVTTRVPIICDEVEVVACDDYPLGIVGKAEAHEAPRDLAEFEGGLALDDLH
jgi:hypothetical protein